MTVRVWRRIVNRRRLAVDAWHWGRRGESSIVSIEPKRASTQLSGDGLRDASAQPIALVVDDEPLVRQLLCAVLARAGWQTVAAADGFEALRLSAEINVDGLTRRGDLQTKLRAFDLGVDDILTVPFSPEELLARAIVITRRATGGDAALVPTIKLGEIEVDILNREVRAGDSVVHLTPIEQSLLYLLASRGGQVITREEALDTIWGTDFVSESNVVDRHIRSLRIKLQNGYRNPRFIATVPGRGYRFIPTFSNEGWRE